MTFFQEQLGAGESLQSQSRPHWVIFAKVGLWALSGGVGLYAAPDFWIGEVLLLVSLVVLGKVTIGYLFTEYLVTDRRILVRSGLIRRRSQELFLGRIEGVQAEQNLIGRLLGYGTVVIIGIGGTRTPLAYLVAPLDFQQIIQQQLSYLSQSGNSERSRNNEYPKSAVGVSEEGESTDNHRGDSNIERVAQSDAKLTESEHREG